MNPMSPEILRKLKNVLRILFLAVVGLVLFFVIVTFYLLSTPQGATRQKIFLSSLPKVQSGGFSSGVNIAPSDMVSQGGEDVSVYENSGVTSQAPAPTISTEERKLIQNGALSLVVDRVEDAVANLARIAETLGGRVDSVGLYNTGGITKKQATVVMRIPAVNFSTGMEQVKSIAKKVQSENISTEDITEKFIDMQARLKNLKAEEAQYLGIMQKASKIEDVLKVSERLYSVRQEIEQLQGQMNYLSRQVDMSVIAINLSSEPDIQATNITWSPTTTAKEAVRAFFEGMAVFFSVIIFLVLSLLPLLILWVTFLAFAVWLLWKLLLALKKRLHRV